MFGIQGSGTQDQRHAWLRGLRYPWTAVRRIFEPWVRGYRHLGQVAGVDVLRVEDEVVDEGETTREQE